MSSPGPMLPPVSWRFSPLLPRRMLADSCSSEEEEHDYRHLVQKESRRLYGGRLFCVTAQRENGEGMRLEGVTLDSSTDDPTPAVTKRNDLSMDSGIQGSSCDLAPCCSGADSDNRSEQQEPDTSLSSSLMRLASDLELQPGETFNLVEEVEVYEDHGQRGDPGLVRATPYSESASSCSPEPQVLDQRSTYLSFSTPSLDAVVPQQPSPHHLVVVAVDIGTTYSGYAFCFIRDTDCTVHMMRKWEGGDPGLNNQKTPTTLLLTPKEEFHSFGFAARDFFHDLDIQEAKKWLYFDKFKMTLHHNQDLNRDTKLAAANGQVMPALTVFAHALRHLKSLALQELGDQTGSDITTTDVRWVVTVPAIWKQPAKQFMREAAYQGGLCDPTHPEDLLIALEPEAASIYCRKLRMNQLVPDHSSESSRRTPCNSSISLESRTLMADSKEGTRYMVVDCGGGTVDITVHELSEHLGTLRELHKASGGPWGSMGIDVEFEHLLEQIFETDFIAQFKLKRPAAYMELMLSFEARKRSASPNRNSSFNIFPPFAFIDYYRKFKGKEIEQAVRKFGRKDITWSTQGMLRLQPNVMMELFQPMLDKIIQHIRNVLESPRVHGIKFLFLVGGFAESQILQHEVRQAFSDKAMVIIPQGVSLTILRGAVLFGLDPGLVTMRRSKQTYGVGVLKRFAHGVHPPEKRIEKNGKEWCADVLDKFVVAEQSVGLGETVMRRYTPACPSQKFIIINIYSADCGNAEFITDEGVQKCGTLQLEIPPLDGETKPNACREIHMRMVFGGTEVMASALDVATGRYVHVEVDFLTSDTEV